MTVIRSFLVFGGLLAASLFAQTPKDGVGAPYTGASATVSLDTTTFTATPTGAVPITAQKRMDQVVLLYDYLSDAERADVTLRTGSLNCSVNFAKAVAAADHGTLILPKGRIKASADLSDLNIIVTGQGIDPIYGTCIINATTNAPALKVFFTNGWNYGVKLQNFCIYGSNSGSNTDTGIEINTMGPVTLDNLYIAQCGSHGVVLGNLKHCTQTVIQNCTFQSNYGAGVFGRSDAQNSKQVNAINILTSTFIQGHSHGIDVWANNFNIEKCTIQGNAGAGIRFYASDLGAANSSSVTSVNVRGNYFELNALGNISAYTEYNATGPIIHYLTGLLIADNYLLQTITAAPTTTASVDLNGTTAGSYKGFTYRNNQSTVTGLAWLDLHNRHDARSVIEIGYRDAQTASWIDTYILNRLTATIVPGNSWQRTSNGPETTSANYVGQESLDAYFNVIQRAIGTGAGAADWKPIMQYSSTAAPTKGCFSKGAYIQNSASAVGQPKGWYCTVAGGANSTTRADNTAVASGVWAAWSTGTTVWECTVAGTTTTGAPSISGKVVGNTVVDGGVTWTMRSTTTATFVSEGNL